jgi:peptidoglycan/xylan/chitin deacetylase (PgdA/CDA1 family)
MAIKQILSATLKRCIPPSLIRYRLGASAGNEVLLTFDDGPDPQTTPRVLDCLAAHSVRAVFFIVGNRIQKAPWLLRTIVKQGHVVGNHSFSHEHTQHLSAREYFNDILRCQRVIEDTCGIVPHLFRPPYGILSIGKIVAIHRAGLLPLCWSAEGGEFGFNKGRSETAIAQHLIHSVGMGDIVLLHDNYESMPNVLSATLPSLVQRGLSFGNAIKAL